MQNGFFTTFFIILSLEMKNLLVSITDKQTRFLELSLEITKNILPNYIQWGLLLLCSLLFVIDIDIGVIIFHHEAIQVLRH